MAAPANAAAVRRRAWIVPQRAVSRAEAFRASVAGRPLVLGLDARTSRAVLDALEKDEPLPAQLREFMASPRNRLPVQVQSGGGQYAPILQYAVLLSRESGITRHIKWILEQSWCDPNAVVTLDHDRAWLQPPALYTACRDGRDDVVRLLLEHGASPAISYGTPGGSCLDLSALLGGYLIHRGNHGVDEADLRRSVECMALVADAGAFRDTYLNTLMIPGVLTPWDPWPGAQAYPMQRPANPAFLRRFVACLVGEGRAPPSRLRVCLMAAVARRMRGQQDVFNTPEIDQYTFDGCYETYHRLTAETVRRHQRRQRADGALRGYLNTDVRDIVGRGYMPPE